MPSPAMRTISLFLVNLLSHLPCLRGELRLSPDQLLQGGYIGSTFIISTEEDNFTHF